MRCVALEALLFLTVHCENVCSKTSCLCYCLFGGAPNPQKTYTSTYSYIRVQNSVLKFLTVHGCKGVSRGSRESHGGNVGLIRGSFLQQMAGTWAPQTVPIVSCLRPLSSSQAYIIAPPPPLHFFSPRLTLFENDFSGTLIFFVGPRAMAVCFAIPSFQQSTKSRRVPWVLNPGLHINNRRAGY